MEVGNSVSGAEQEGIIQPNPYPMSHPVSNKEKLLTFASHDPVQIISIIRLEM